MQTIQWIFATYCKVLDERLEFKINFNVDIQYFVCLLNWLHFFYFSLGSEKLCFVVFLSFIVSSFSFFVYFIFILLVSFFIFLLCFLSFSSFCFFLFLFDFFSVFICFLSRFSVFLFSFLSLRRDYIRMANFRTSLEYCIIKVVSILSLSVPLRIS